MQARLIAGRIYVHGPPRHSPTFSMIPSARWNKKLGCYSYAASPLSLVRLKHHAKLLEDDFETDENFDQLEDEWQRMQEAKKWKTPEMIAEVEEEIAKDKATGGNPFMTDTLPWPHQYRGRRFIEKRASTYLGMWMGTGKTLVVIEELLRMMPRRTLILCPKSVVPVWPVEFAEHYPNHTFQIVPLVMPGGKKKADTFSMMAKVAEVRKQNIIFICNYESSFREPLSKLFENTFWDVVILDEAHKIKSPGGKTSRFMTHVRADRRILMSGTPIPNNKLDIYGQFRFLDPGAFGTSFQRFRDTYAVMGGYGGHQVMGWRNEKRFNKILDLYMFRVDKDVLNLPPFIESFRAVSLPAKARRIHNKLEADYISETDGGSTVTAANVLAKTMKLRQICSGFVVDDHGNEELIHEERKKVLKEILEDLPPGEKAVVFTEFTHDLDQVKQVAYELDMEYGELSGHANDLEDSEIPSHIRVLGANAKSGSLGVNFTAAKYCIFYSISYNLAEHMQAMDRHHRGDIKHTVNYISLVSPNTIEPEIYHALKTKGDLIKTIMEYVKKGGQGRGI